MFNTFNISFNFNIRDSGSIAIVNKRGLNGQPTTEATGEVYRRCIHSINLE